MHNMKSLVKGPDRAQLMMSSADGQSRSLGDGSLVRVRSRAGEVLARVLLTDDVMPGVVSLPHGFGHAVAADTMHVAGAVPGESINGVTDEQLVEPILGNSILNGIPVEVEPVEAPH
jgi:anaerobic selenocysteine-containing dehydrogenase